MSTIGSFGPVNDAFGSSTRSAQLADPTLLRDNNLPLSGGISAELRQTVMPRPVVEPGIGPTADHYHRFKKEMLSGFLIFALAPSAVILPPFATGAAKPEPNRLDSDSLPVLYIN